MNHALSLLLGALLISAVCLAAEHPERTTEPAVSEDTGVAIGAPSALRLNIVRNGFQLNWTLSPQDPGVVTGYEIARADVFSGPYETVGVVEKGILTFVDRTARPETIYFYKVRALAGDRYSPFSGEAAGEIPGTP